jgi:hypothetical protein
MAEVAQSLKSVINIKNPAWLRIAKYPSSPSKPVNQKKTDWRGF